MSQVTAGSTDAPGVLMSGLVTFLLNHWGYLVILALLTLFPQLVLVPMNFLLGK